jgi:hypothetical protein
MPKRRGPVLEHQISTLASPSDFSMDNATNVIIGFPFTFMPGSHHNRQKPESPVGVASTESGAGLRRSACRVWSAAGASTTPRNRGDAKRERAKPRIRGFERARNAENARMNPPRIGWQEMHNLFDILRFDQKHKTNWHLTMWTDCGKRT